MERSAIVSSLLLLALCACKLPTTPAVEHGLPQNPYRVVSVAPQTFEDIVALGIAPVGAYRVYTDQALMSADTWQSIHPLTAPPNVEQVLSLRPDVIFTVGPNAAESLSRIAPTINIKDFTNFSDWRTRHREVARLLHREPQAEAGIADTDRKIDQVRADFARHPFRVLMGHVSANTRSMVIFPDNQNTAKLMKAIGLRYGKLHNQNLSDSHGTTVSWERVDDLDCDAFFVTPAPYENLAERDKVAQQLALLAAQPLWNRLSFVKAGHVFYMDSYWQMITPITADRVMEDLERDLLGRDLDSQWHIRLPLSSSSGS
ncbi:Iron(III) dicitrate transport system, periplasmic iron-binding protein FecB [Acidisarcina polymorpha]|uniref:Iron(III) dicitrate transport system, periplasmic iron-binding protein FecB n=1 Tax=Acidisarcina polymorpha TaxID=2211140 RepID=A0A2Z5G4B9_9BACT|nr:ABC transporter substrate-binding protein [Acidisarcina polymorpha]AXC13992.1 Iron(III) dicitrate transport system, periplasmic iron-binding protein FecB [Acidisarcina polymorpha]